MTTEVLVYNHGPHPLYVRERTRNPDGSFGKAGEARAYEKNNYHRSYVHSQLDLLFETDGSHLTIVNLGASKDLDIDVFGHNAEGKFERAAIGLFLQPGETSDGSFGGNGNQLAVFKGHTVIVQEYDDEKN